MYSQSIKTVANSGNLNELGEVVQKVQLGTMLQLQQLTLTGLAASATLNLSALGYPAIGAILSLRVTAGAAAAGVRMVADAAGTASATVALVSADGKTLTFEDTVTAVVIQYMPRSAVDMAGNFARL